MRRTRLRISILFLILSVTLCSTSIAFAESNATPRREPSAEPQSESPPPFGPEELIATGRVRLRVHTDPDSEIVIGQQTRLLVEILTDSRFSKAPRYPELSIPGAITLMPEQMGTNFTERIEGTTFTGQRRGYVLFPQRLGPLEIPPIEIKLAVVREDDASIPLVLRTPALTVEVEPRPGIDERDALVTTPLLRVSDEWDRPLRDLDAGDAIERTIRIEGDQVLGMLLPPLAFEAPPGVDVYPDPPRIRDRINRGRYRGERTQTVTYILTERGAFDIPAIEIPWWNVTDHQLDVAQLEAQTIEVSGSILGVSGRSSMSAALAAFGSRIARSGMALASWLIDHGVALLIFAVAGFSTLWVANTLGPRARSSWNESRRRHQNSEKETYKALRRAIAGGDQDRIVQTYWHWRDRLEKTYPHSAEPDSRRLPHDTEPSAAWRAFEADRYGTRGRPEDSADVTARRRELEDELRTLRSHVLAEGRAARSGERRAQKTLNPRGAQNAGRANARINA